jgi:polysaccharide pyruvyl transferase WcaK-like protein
VKQWTKKQILSGKIVIGISPHAFLKASNKKLMPCDISSYYISLVKKIGESNQNLVFLLLPHDYRTLENNLSDALLAEKVYAVLKETLDSRIHLAPGPLTAKEIKNLVGSLDFVLSARMHLAIACLGRKTPVGCISYQGKFQGLFKHFDLEGMFIDRDALFEIDSDRLTDWLLKLIDDRDGIRQKIADKLPIIQSLAARNFD